jgi:AcrR family transcriptional regulator
MGSKERRAREQHERRAHILEAAYAIAMEQGSWRKITVRAVADRIEYTHPTIYESFPNKDAILRELLALGFAQLHDALQTASPSEHAPDRLHAIAEAYWRFAFREPVLYDLMHTLDGVPFGTPDTPSAARAAFAVLRDAVAAVLPADTAQQVDLDGETDLLWSTLHGLLTLTLSGRMAHGYDRATQLLQRAIDNLVLALQSRSFER